jgi:hypothetical protein
MDNISALVYWAQPGIVTQHLWPLLATLRPNSTTMFHLQSYLVIALMFYLLSFWFAYFAVVLLVDDVGLEMAYDANNTMR